jgi:hypothetical protein
MQVMSLQPNVVQVQPVAMAVAVAVAVTATTKTTITRKEVDVTPDTPATVDPPTEPPKVTGSQPTVNAAEPNQERGRSLRESRWANPDPDFNPIEDGRARGLPGLTGKPRSVVG